MADAPQYEMLEPAARLDNSGLADARVQEADVKTVSQKSYVNPSLLQSFRETWKQMRIGSIRALPRFLVNNSSNLIGAMHVGTEMMMFKAANKDGHLIDNPSNPVNWIKDPIKNVFMDAFRRSKSEQLNYGELFKGNAFKNIYRRITDTAAATQRVRTSPSNIGKPLDQIRLGNPWQTRSTLIGLIVWSLSALIPEKKDSDEEIERMTIKSRTNPVGYVLERFKQAIWVPQWAYNKRQMIGLGILIQGIFSAVGAWRGRTEINDIHNYRFNWGYLATSVVTTIASLPLLFASDERRGYGGFGSIMLFRIPFLYPSLKTKFDPKQPEPGRHWYAASMASFQTENFLQALIGGAEKKPDGTIVDHSEVREEAARKAKLERLERKAEKEKGESDDAHKKLAQAKDQLKPQAQVQQVSGLAPAMPKRIASLQQEQTGVAASVY